MKKLLLLTAMTVLSSCALTQRTLTDKCPTAPALVGDALLAAVPMVYAVDAYTKYDGFGTVVGLAVFAAVVTTAVVATENCQ